MADHEGAQNWSWLVNWLLLVMKLAIAILSNSKAVWAAFAGKPCPALLCPTVVFCKSVFCVISPSLFVFVFVFSYICCLLLSSVV
jgi:hypothetical protein